MFRKAIDFLKASNFLKANNFLKDRRGNIAPIFAFALVPTVGMIGAAVDYPHANSLRTAMQAALDSTTLAMASSAGTVSEDVLKENAKKYFNAVFQKPGATNVALTTRYASNNGFQLVMTADATVKTDFMNIPGVGISQIPIRAESVTTWGNRRLRVALALDNTGSMSSSGKMDALKKAAKGLIDQLKTAATNDGDVYVSIIPFAKDVNVGKENKDADWLKWGEVWDNSKSSCSKSNYTTKKSCQDNNGKWTVATQAQWTGCVADRDTPNDTNNVPPSNLKGDATLFPREQYADCPVSIMPLSYNWQALKDKIDSMQPTGNTNTTIGLEWGWHSLTQGAPLNAPAEDPKYEYTKIIIFLTDGDNTQNRFTSTQKDIDARMKLACANAKGTNDPKKNPNDIEIYTILVMQGSEPLLKECASSKEGTTDHYFKITKADQMVTVFKQIGTQLSQLRVAK